MNNRTRLLADLEHADVRVSEREAADAIWLAVHMTGEVQRSLVTGPGPTEDRSAGRARSTAPHRDDARPGRPEHAGEDEDALARVGLSHRSPVRPDAAPTGHDALPIRLATARELHRPLELQRALRPLKRRVSAGFTTTLDEEATVERSADVGAILPILTRERQRWLSLALVIDASPSMALWDQLAGELRALLGHVGAFRAVRVWRLHGGGRPAISPASAAAAVRRSPRELVDPTGRQAILVLTDCVADVWHSGQAIGVLEAWARTGPLAILQPLPQRVWARSAVPFQYASLRSPEPGVPNDRLLAELADPYPTGRPPGVPVPLLEIGPDWLASWAGLIAGTAHAGTDAIVTFTGEAPSAAATADRAALDPGAPGDNPERVVERFMSGASPDAFRLAGLLAAAPLSLPLMRLIQRAMLPDPRPFQLAEVFLGGLMRWVETSERGPAAQFDFLPGVREVLLGSIRREEAAQVSELVSAELSRAQDAAQTGFTALISVAAGTGRPMTTADVPYAKVETQVLRRIGGRYAEVAAAADAGADRVPAASEPADASAAPAADDQSAGPDAGPDEPAPASMPPTIWNAGPRNHDFTGREETLLRIRDELADRSSAAFMPTVLYGLGGVGKTQIALEFAHRFMYDYDLVWWVPAETVARIEAALAKLAYRLGQARDDVPETAAGAVEALRRGSAGRWLLIFDNADDPADLPPFLPEPSEQGHVIITSRQPGWANGTQQIEVNVFSREESTAHLLRHLPELDPADASRVTELLGDLPLAIEQAAVWLEETGMPASQYADALEAQTTQILALNQPADYPTPVAATWNLSLERLKASSPAAIRLLQICAFCAPSPISTKLLFSDEMHAALLPYDARLSEKNTLARVVRDCSRFALIKVDPAEDSIRIHRLVQAVIRAQMTDEEQDDACHEVHRILVGARPPQGETDDPENWPRFALIWPHLVPSRADDCDEAATRQLSIDRVHYLSLRGEFDDALRLGDRLDSRWTAKLGPDDVQTLFVRFTVAQVLRSEGHFGAARDLDAEVMGRQQAVLGPDHLHGLMTAVSLAADLRALGDYAGALDLARDAFGKISEQFGSEFPRTLAAASDLATCHLLAGDYARARNIDRETLATRQAVLRADHPHTLSSAVNLARDLRWAGGFAESAERLRGAYESYREVLGEDAVDTLRAARSLAVSLRRLGRQARGLSEQSYGRYLQSYGREFPDTLACKLSLACDYRAEGDVPRAERTAAEVRAACQQVFGHDHLYTLAAANNLAIYLRHRGEARQARTVAEQTLAAMSARFGEQHPFTLTCHVNLASCVAEDRDLAGAEGLLQRADARLTAMFGGRHPDTLACRANIAVTLHHYEQRGQAALICEQVLEEMNQVLGADHPDVTALTGWRYIDRELDVEPL